MGANWLTSPAARVISSLPGVARQVDVAAEVRQRAPGRLLREFVYRLEETELSCVVCGRDIPVGSLEPVAVQLLVDPDDPTVRMLVPSHGRCEPSGVHERPGFAERLAGSLSGEHDARWYPLMLPGHHLAVVWESSLRVVSSDDAALDEVVDAELAGYFAAGFQLVSPADIDSEALPGLPLLPSWSASIRDDGQFVIVAENGDLALDVTIEPDDTLDLMRELTRTADWLVALTGVNLHVDADPREAGLYHAATTGCLAGARIAMNEGS